MNKLILTTAGSSEEANRIAHALVKRRLAACANIIGPMHSVYRWNDAIENAEEWLLLIKTSEEKYDAVELAIRELHTYELPECIAIPIESGAAAYLRWIEESVR
jgi:periplasmic divalent cation tolerance protein